MTGGAGFIGSHACKALAKTGHRPVTCDNLSRGRRESVKWGPLEVGDIADTAWMRAVLERYRPAAVIHFAAYAYPDEWAVLGYGDKQPAFFNEYIADFNPSGQHRAGIYGFTRADNDTILSYDAIVALLKGCDNALKAGKTQPTPQDVQQGLKLVTGPNSFQGVSGQIAFGADGNPVNKALVILYVDNGHIKMEPFQLGRFLK